MLLCPLQSTVSPNKTSLSTARWPLEPAKVRFTALREGAEDTVMLHAPLASAVKGLEGSTLAPAGSPLSVTTSLAPARPHTRAGRLPWLRQDVLAESTMLLLKEQGLGPHALEVAQEGEGPDASKGSARSCAEDTHASRRREACDRDIFL